MSDREQTAIAELVFSLGKATRHAFDSESVNATPVALARIATNLLEAGLEKNVGSELMMVFVAGFEEGDPPERRVDPDNR